ncbi:MAG TPA: succinylglutamate desuccinylase/aspartoacylase family protein, partial [Bacteroidales bacterium]
ETLNKMGKTSLLFEGGKSNNLDSSVINCGVEGALNVLKYLGLQDGEPIKKNESIIIKKSKWVRAPYSGMFQYSVKNGSKVKKREVLGIITDSYGEFEKKVFAPFEGYVFCVNTAPIVNKGDALFNMTVEVEE